MRRKEEEKIELNSLRSFSTFCCFTFQLIFEIFFLHPLFSSFFPLNKRSIILRKGQFSIFSFFLLLCVCMLCVLCSSMPLIRTTIGIPTYDIDHHTIDRFSFAFFFFVGVVIVIIIFCHACTKPFFKGICEHYFFITLILHSFTQFFPPKTVKFAFCTT